MYRYNATSPRPEILHTELYVRVSLGSMCVRYVASWRARRVHGAARDGDDPVEMVRTVN